MEVFYHGCRPVSAPVSSGYTAPGHSRHISGSYSSNATSPSIIPRLTHNMACVNQNGYRKSHPPHYGHPRPQSKAVVRGPSKDYENDEKWLNNLCVEPPNDTETCCEGYFVPCVTYSRTQYRLKQMAVDQDPLDTTEFKGCNKVCWSFYCLAALVGTDWVLVMMQHSRIRAMYNIEGSTSGDCVVAYFCTRCVVMQDERELRAREAHGNQERNKLRNGSAVVADQPRLHHDMSDDPANPLQKQADQRRPENKDDKKANDTSNHHSDSASNNSHAGSEHIKPQKHPEMTKHGAGEIGHESLQIFKKGKEPIRDTSDSQDLTRPALNRDDIVSSRQSWRDRKPILAHHTASARSVSSPEQTREFSSEKRSARKPSQLITNQRLIDGTAGNLGTFQRNALINSRRDRSSQSSTDEAVLVYYGAGEIPQRHRLEDCTRLRASTPGRPDTPCYNHVPSDCHAYITEAEGQPSAPLQADSIQESKEPIVAPNESSSELQCALDKPARNSSRDHDHGHEQDGKEGSGTRKGTTKPSVTDAAVEHHLAECAEIVAAPVSPPERKTLQHSRYQCTAESASESSEEPEPECGAAVEHSEQYCIDTYENDKTELNGTDIQIQRDAEYEAQKDENGKISVVLTNKTNNEQYEGEPHNLNECKPDERENISVDTSSVKPSQQDDILDSQDSTSLAKLTVAAPNKAASLLRIILGDPRSISTRTHPEALSRASAPAHVAKAEGETAKEIVDTIKAKKHMASRNAGAAKPKSKNNGGKSRGARDKGVESRES